MNPRKRVLLASGVVLLVLVFSLKTLMSPDEPSYGGKSLSDWLKQLASPSAQPGLAEANYQEARTALKAMGTNIFPHLLSSLEADDPKLVKWLSKHSRPTFGITWPMELAKDRQQQASIAIMAFGAEALPLFPDLIRLAREGRSQGTRLSAMYSLQIFKNKGEQIAPVLIQAMTDTNIYLHSHAIHLVRSLELQRPELVPALTNILIKSPVDARSEAAVALGEIGTSGSNAVPALIEALNDPEPVNRAHAAATLGKIGVKSESVRKALSARTNDIAGVRVQAEVALWNLFHESRGSNRVIEAKR